MEDEFVHKNPRNLVEERFLRLEEKVDDISRNMTLLMEATLPTEVYNLIPTEVKPLLKMLNSDMLTPLKVIFLCC
jgi:hypothetical protein